MNPRTSIGAGGDEKDTISFGPFRLIVAERLLMKADTPVPLGGRAMDILVALLERAGEVVTKKELMDRVWPNLTVEEVNLRYHVAGLRKALGDGQSGVRYIANIPCRGYCFVAPVSRPGSATPSSTYELACDQLLKLPPRLTRMIGRDHNVAQISRELMAHRFVTILGPGGIGKTTVAIAVGHALLSEFDNAVCFVDLGPLSDPLLVPSAIASTLGLMVHSSNPIPGLIAFLRDKRMMLVLDSCEHVIDTAAKLTESIIYEAPEVHILATSREALRAEGEYVHRLHPLESPPDNADLKAADVLRFSAAQLFVERATANRGPFELSDAEAPVVAEICRRLDGMALALELAAGRVDAYGLRGTAELLGSQFELLWEGRRTAVPRHQTLGATLDWSHNLLSQLERVVLRRLTVFVGFFTLEAAQAVVTGDDASKSDAVGAIASLVSKSLVSAHSNAGSVRYRLLDTTRAYVLEKLVESGETDQIARRHATHFRDFLERINNIEGDTRSLKGFALYGIHLGNVRAALEWGFSSHGDVEIATALGAASARLFMELALLTECHIWCQRAIGLLDRNSLGGRREMELQAAIGQSLMFTKSNSEDVRIAFTRGLEIAEQLDEPYVQLQLLGGLHLFTERIGDFRGSLVFAERSLVVAKRLSHPTAIAAAHSWLAISHHLIGDQGAAAAHLDEALSTPPASRRSDTVQFGFDYQNRARITLARNLWLRGFPEQAVAVAQQTIDDAASLEHPVTLCMALIWAVNVFLWLREWPRVEENINRFTAHAERYSLAPYLPVGIAVKAELAIWRGDPNAGIGALRGCLGALHAGRYELLTTEFIGALAQGLAMVERFPEGLTTINRAIDQADRNGQLFIMPELLRIKADMLLSQPEVNRRAAEDCLVVSIEQARSQSALSWELRSAISLSRLWVSEGRRDEARRTLSSIYKRFTEGFETSDLKAARHLLTDLEQPSDGR